MQLSLYWYARPWPLMHVSRLTVWNYRWAKIYGPVLPRRRWLYCDNFLRSLQKNVEDILRQVSSDQHAYSWSMAAHEASMLSYTQNIMSSRISPRICSWDSRHQQQPMVSLRFPPNSVWTLSLIKQFWLPLNSYAVFWWKAQFQCYIS